MVNKSITMATLLLVRWLHHFARSDFSIWLKCSSTRSWLSPPCIKIHKAVRSLRLNIFITTLHLFTQHFCGSRPIIQISMLLAKALFISCSLQAPASARVRCFFCELLVGTGPAAKRFPVSSELLREPQPGSDAEHCGRCLGLFAIAFQTRGPGQWEWNCYAGKE